ncbi:hypothetical protein KIPB_013961, partial [Kipferlia bialata]
GLASGIQGVTPETYQGVPQVPPGHCVVQTINGVTRVYTGAEAQALLTQTHRAQQAQIQ